MCFGPEELVRLTASDGPDAKFFLDAGTIVHGGEEMGGAP